MRLFKERDLRERDNDNKKRKGVTPIDDVIIIMICRDIVEQTNATLSVQIGGHSESAELRRDGAIELILVEVTERATINECENKAIIDNEISRRRIIHIGKAMKFWAVQRVHLSEVAQLWWNGASELI